MMQRTLTEVLLCFVDFEPPKCHCFVKLAGRVAYYSGKLKQFFLLKDWCSWNVGEKTLKLLHIFSHLENGLYKSEN